MWFILSFVVIVTTHAQSLDTTEYKIQHQIDAAIKFMCKNQFESNGQFLYEAQLKQTTIEIDVEANNAPRQGGGFYTIGMYYRLNHNKHKNVEQGFSITDCIHNTMRYLKTQSLPIVFDSDQHEILNKKTIAQRGELMHGNTGATALSILGLIEICIVHDDICNQYSAQFLSWINGLITMRKHKLTVDNSVLKTGAFAKKLTATDVTSAYYDSASYVALARLLQYKTQLSHVMDVENELWTHILDIVNGLDEYYIEYTSADDAHWLIQAWYTRWVTLNENSEYFDNFMNHFMLDLMQHKLETKMDTNYVGARCYLVEAMVDVIHSTQVMKVHSEYNNNVTDVLDVFNAAIWSVMGKRYKYLNGQQVFAEQVDFYFETRFDGGFLGDSARELLRIDDTQHCACALMKINALVFEGSGVGEVELYAYMNYNDPVVDDSVKSGFANATNYDIMISAICLVVVIVLVNIIFFYWCYYYPKEQKQRNDLFWLGQTGLESQTSDAANAESDVA